MWDVGAQTGEMYTGIPFVILSGRRETGALLRQLSEGKVRKEAAILPVHPPGLVIPPSLFSVLTFYTGCLYSVFLWLKATAKTQVPSLWPIFFTLSIWVGKDSLVEPGLFFSFHCACPRRYPHHCPCCFFWSHTCTVLHFNLFFFLPALTDT